MPVFRRKQYILNNYILTFLIIFFVFNHYLQCFRDFYALFATDGIILIFELCDWG